MTKWDTLYIGGLTLFLIATINYYESKVKKLRRSVKAGEVIYDELVQYANEITDDLSDKSNELASMGGSQRHYTQLQLENTELKAAIEDYKRAISLSKHQSDTPKTQGIINQLDLDNRMLQAQIERLKLQITELKNGIHTGYPSPIMDWHVTQNEL